MGYGGGRRRRAGGMVEGRMGLDSWKEKGGGIGGRGRQGEVMG
ncbi:hypothetical protein [Escherichia coli]|nr:hypothetical protein [Escherichia coli]